MVPNPSIRLSRPVAQVRVIAGGSAGEAPAQADAPRKPLASAIAALEQAMEQLRARQEQLVRQAEGQMVDLAIQIARKVLMQEIQAGRYEIDPIVKEALASLPVRQEVLVRLHPADLASCELARQGGAEAPGAVRFVGDASIPKAHCLLETSQGVVESTVDGHLVRVAQALKGLG